MKWTYFRTRIQSFL